MEGALITDTLVSPSFPSLPVLHEPMWARWSTRERHNHAELTGHTSSDSKRNECTPANADELVSTAVDAAAGLLNTALRLLRVRRDTSIGLISYSVYLWHWPLLSFARVMNGATPPAIARLALIGDVNK